MTLSVESLFARANRLLANALETHVIPEKFLGSLRTDVFPEADGHRVFELQASDGESLMPVVLCRAIMNVADGTGRVEVTELVVPKRKRMAAAV